MGRREIHGLNMLPGTGIHLVERRASRRNVVETMTSTSMMDIQVGDVGGVIDDLEIAIAMEHRPAIVTSTQIFYTDKIVAFRADAKADIDIASEMKTDADIDSGITIFRAIEGLGRQGSPSAIIATVTPTHPCRCPAIAGYPDPTKAIDIGPAAIVIRGPAPRFIGYPRKSSGRIDPGTIRVGCPIVIADVRLEDITVIIGLDPIALAGQLIVKSLEGNILIVAVVLRPYEGWSEGKGQDG